MRTLHLSANIKQTDDEACVYRKHDGRALGVHLTWKGVKLLVLITHAPSDHPAQKAWFQRVRDDLAGVYANLPDTLGQRQCVWMSDNNLVPDPTLDERPARAMLTSAEAAAAEEMRQLGLLIGATEDLYRRLHPDGTEITHEQSGQTPRRLDTTKASKKMLGEGATHGEPIVCSVRHVHHHEHECAYNPGTAAARLKKFDHRGIAFTFRVSDVPVKRKYTFPSEIMEEAEGAQHIAKTMAMAVTTRAP